MKTTFGRTFLLVTVVLLVALLSIGVFLRSLLRGYLDETTFDRLEKDAHTISQLASGYSRQNALAGQEFFTNLNVVSHVSEADTVICNAKGTILLCSEDFKECPHRGKVLGSEYLRRVLDNGTSHDMGLIEGLYEDERYVCATSIIHDGKVQGYVIVSMPVAASQKVLEKMTDYYVLLSVVVVLLAVSVVSIFVHRQSKPLTLMAKTARDFGHGNLSSRVPIRDGYTYEVGQLAQSFNTMAASLEKSESQRREFIANVSHELKTPMTTIGGYVDGVLDGTIPAANSKRYLQVVSDETKRLSRLVRSMLDLSQLRDEPIAAENRARFDLTEAAGRVLLSFEQKINDKKLQVEVLFPEHSVFTNGNQDFITQVIYNLLDNAVKFCPQEGTLGLCIREMKGKAFVSVYNDGQTIPAEELPLVFDRFHKTDKSRSENRDSWGLGLYIAKTIVSAHGETISVTSVDGRTEFTFTMPLLS